MRKKELLCIFALLGIVITAGLAYADCGERASSFGDSSSINGTEGFQEYKTFVAECPGEAVKNIPLFEAAVSQNPALMVALMNDGTAAESYFQSKNIPMNSVAGGKIKSYTSDGKFTTENGDEFTMAGLNSMKLQGYSFEISNEGKLVLKTGSVTYTSDTAENKPIKLDNSGSITNGKLARDDGKTIEILNGKLTPQSNGNFKVEGKVYVDSSYDSTFSSERFTLSFNQGKCPASTNCIDITNKKLSIRNTGDGAAEMQASFPAKYNAEENKFTGPYESMEVKSGDKKITVTETKEDGLNATAVFQNGKPAFDNGVGFSSLKNINSENNAGDISYKSGANADNTGTEWQKCNVPATEGKATGFLGKAIEWVTGKQVSEKIICSTFLTVKDQGILKAEKPSMTVTKLEGKTLDKERKTVDGTFEMKLFSLINKNNKPVEENNFNFYSLEEPCFTNSEGKKSCLFIPPTYVKIPNNLLTNEKNNFLNKEDAKLIINWAYYNLCTNNIKTNCESVKPSNNLPSGVEISPNIAKPEK